MATQTILEVDTRKRVSLGAAATAERYLLTQEKNGTLILTPAVVLSEEEVRLLQRPDILQAVEESRARSAAGKPGAERPVRRRNTETEAA